MQGVAPASKYTNVPGWESEDEQELLLDLAKRVGDKAVIFEIGGEFGMSASLFAKGNPTAHIYSMDVRYDGDVGRIHEANLKEAGLAANVKRIASNSQLQIAVDNFTEVEPGGIDLLFIDGDHSVQGCLNDLNLWSPLVKEGGYMAIHDTACTTNRMPHVIHFDVTRALALFLEKNGAAWIMKHMVNTITCFQRLATPIETDIVDGDLVPKVKPATTRRGRK